MGRYIDADKLNMAFTMLRFNEDGTLRHWDDRKNWCMSGQEVEDLINSIPTADVVERKRGKWRMCTEAIEETFHIGCRCTVCNYWKPMGIWNYCPSCGADMMERSEDGSETDGSHYAD